MFGKKTSTNAAAAITGAGSGIGRAFTLEIAARGGRVVCSGVKQDTAEETADMIRTAGGEATAVACDVTRLAEVEALAATAEQAEPGAS